MSNWNLEGLMVEGTYLGEFPVSGKVELSRVKFGGGVCHTIAMDYPIEVYGSSRDRVIIEHSEVIRVFEV